MSSGTTTLSCFCSSLALLDGTALWGSLFLAVCGCTWVLGSHTVLYAWTVSHIWYLLFFPLYNW